MKIGKIVPGHGVIGNFLLGQPISQVLFRLQSQPRSFGPINIVQSEAQKDKAIKESQVPAQPIFLILPSGFKFRFDPVYHRLDQIEIFTDVPNNQYIVPDMLIGASNDPMDSDGAGASARMMNGGASQEVSIFGTAMQANSSGPVMGGIGQVPS